MALGAVVRELQKVMAEDGLPGEIEHECQEPTAVRRAVGINHMEKTLITADVTAEFDELIVGLRRVVDGVAGAQVIIQRDVRAAAAHEQVHGRDNGGREVFGSEFAGLHGFSSEIYLPEVPKVLSWRSVISQMKLFSWASFFARACRSADLGYSMRRMGFCFIRFRWPRTSRVSAAG
jgi:hypothetical protein